MSLSDIRFPMQLEVDETVEAVRKALMARTVKLVMAEHQDVVSEA
jgi:hypothetical protein